MLESIVFAGTALRFLQRDRLIVGIEAWYWFPKGREKQTCHGELVSLWAFLLQRPLVLLQCLHIQKLRKTLAGRHPRLCSKCSESTSVLHHARELKAFAGPGCGGVGCSVLQLESLPPMGKCKASAIVSSSWLLAEGMGLYRGVKVIATSS